MKKYYVYKLESLNGEYYFGSRGCDCDPIDDTYMGSPSVWKPNKDELLKTIIRNFNTRKEAILFERELIIKNINNKLNMNFSIPHPNICRENLITAIDKDGNVISISSDDPLYGIEYFGVTKGKVLVRDVDGNVFYTDIKDKRYLSGELVHNNKGLITGKDHPNYDKVWINNGKLQRLIPKDSPYPNGWKYGTLQKGKTTPSAHAGTCWVHNDKENKRISSVELGEYLENGWVRGRNKLGSYKRKKK